MNSSFPLETHREASLAGASVPAAFIPMPEGRSSGGGDDSLPVTANRMGLTRRQMDVMRFVQGYFAARGYSPGLDEIAGGIGFRSKSSAQFIMMGLIERGYIRTLPNRARAIEILLPVSIPSIGARPLYFVQNVGCDLPDGDRLANPLSIHSTTDSPQEQRNHGRNSIAGTGFRRSATRDVPVGAEGMRAFD